MTVSENSNITAFRELVPAIIKNPDQLYLNSSYQPPLNKIVSDSITEYLETGLVDLDVKPKYIAKCEETRLKIAKFINAEPENIIFTRDTTEGVNLFQRSIKFEKGDNVVILDGEHPNQGFGWLGLERAGEIEVRLVKTDETKDLKPFSASDFKPYVNSKTKAVGISSIMFHSGLRNDVKSLVKEFKSKGIHVLVDATQEAGFGKIDVKDLGISAIAFGIHKGLNIPTGLGILYIEAETLPLLKEIPPILCAGSISNLNSTLIISKDFKVFQTGQKFEHLNKPMMQCIALGSYLDYINETIGGVEVVQEYLEDLGLYLREGLRNIGVKTLGPNEVISRSPQSNIVALYGEGWIKFFTEKKVFVSPYRCGFRVSFGLYNNKEDVDRFIQIVQEGLKQGL